MTMDEIKEDQWYKDRPQVIKDMIEVSPPNVLYQLKSTGEIVRIYAYTETGSIRVLKLDEAEPDHVCEECCPAAFYKPHELEALSEAETHRLLLEGLINKS